MLSFSDPQKSLLVSEPSLQSSMQSGGIGSLKQMLQQVGWMGWLNGHCNISKKDVAPTCEISRNP